MRLAPAALRLCLVTDRTLAGGRDLPTVVAAAVRGGCTMVQIREKTAPTRRFLEEARALRALLQPLGIPLIVNDRVDVALAVGADGVHVGQDDMPVALVRRLIGPDGIVGLSITSRSELDTPDTAAADYLGVGPIFAQTTKIDATPPLGLDGLRAIREATAKPILAIGGLTPSHAAAVLANGADGLAVVSAIMTAEDPERAARAFSQRARPSPSPTAGL